MLQDYVTSFSRLYFSPPRFSSPPLSLSPPFRPFLLRPCQILPSISSLVRPVARCRQRFLTETLGAFLGYSRPSSFHTLPKLIWCGSWGCNLGQSLSNHVPHVFYRRKIRRAIRPGKQLNLVNNEEPLDNACHVWSCIILFEYNDQTSKITAFCNVWRMTKSEVRVAAIVGCNLCHMPCHRMRKSLVVSLGYHSPCGFHILPKYIWCCSEVCQVSRGASMNHTFSICKRSGEQAGQEGNSI
ncbi:uncharacterized protein TNCV_40421 [Trichonephila clavipes]|nr:uncharacterized protein TNCV_40421 [Trichonephila clavipes]